MPAFQMQTILFFTAVYAVVLKAQLIINNEQVWNDDYLFDSSGKNGWSISKISGYDLPAEVSNPLVSIAGTPKYHGPFPASYRLERYFKCNTTNDTRFWITLLPSYCNTDRRNDKIQFNLFDADDQCVICNQQYLLNDQELALNASDLPYVQTATSQYYTNHASTLSTNDEPPSCGDTASYDTTTTSASDTGTPAPTSWLNEGQWYTACAVYGSLIYPGYQTFATAVNSPLTGGDEYRVTIDINLNGDPDEYVIITGISALCAEIVFPTVPPTSPPVVATTEEAIVSTTEQEVPSTTEDVASTMATTETVVITTTPDGRFQEPTKEDATTQIWCQHCALYAILALCGISLCLLLMLCTFYAYWKKAERDKKQMQETDHHKHVKTPTHTPTQSDSLHISGEVKITAKDLDDAVMDDEEDEEVENEEFDGVGTYPVHNDANLMEYDEMDERDKQIHVAVVSPQGLALSPQEAHAEALGFDEEQQNPEIEETEEDATSYEMLGVSQRPELGGQASDYSHYE